jgi:hypothetical protein
MARVVVGRAVPGGVAERDGALHGAKLGIRR